MNNIIIGKWADLLPQIKSEKNLSKLHKKLNITYSHCSSLVNEFNRRGWVKIDSNKKRRDNKLTLTKKGQKVAIVLLALKEAMEV